MKKCSIALLPGDGIEDSVAKTVVRDCKPAEAGGKTSTVGFTQTVIRR